jgi:hypothetical protein
VLAGGRAARSGRRARSSASRRTPPAVGVHHHPGAAAAAVASAIFSASQTSGALQCSAIAKPIRRRAVEIDHARPVQRAVPRRVNRVNPRTTPHSDIRRRRLEVALEQVREHRGALLGPRQRPPAGPALARNPSRLIRSATVLTDSPSRQGSRDQLGMHPRRAVLPVIPVNTARISRSSSCLRSCARVGGRPRWLIEPRQRQPQRAALHRDRNPMHGPLRLHQSDHGLRPIASST